MKAKTRAVFYRAPNKDAHLGSPPLPTLHVGNHGALTVPGADEGWWTTEYEDFYRGGWRLTVIAYGRGLRWRIAAATIEPLPA